MKPFSKSYLSIIYFLLYLPLVVIIVFSFNNSKLSLIWHGFTWKWYGELFHDQNLFVITLHSISIATIASSVATLFAIIAATTFYRFSFRSKHLLKNLLYVLIVIPDLMLAIAFLLFFKYTHLQLGFWSLLIAHITFCIPFATVTITARMANMNKNLIDAARDLGANELTIYRNILIPLLLPAIIAGWLLSFTLSLDDVVISYFVSGPSFEILPLKIYSSVRLGIKPEINALCTILLIATTAIVMAAQWFLHKKN